MSVYDSYFKLGSELEQLVDGPGETIGTIGNIAIDDLMEGFQDLLSESLGSGSKGVRGGPGGNRSRLEIDHLREQMFGKDDRRAKLEIQPTATPDITDRLAAARGLKLLGFDRPIESLTLEDAAPVEQMAQIRRNRDFYERIGWETAALHLRGGAKDDMSLAILDAGDMAALESVATEDNPVPGQSTKEVLSDPDRLARFFERATDVLFGRPLKQAMQGVYARWMKSTATAADAAARNPTPPGVAPTPPTPIPCKLQATLNDGIRVFYSPASLTRITSMDTLSRFNDPATAFLKPADYCFAGRLQGQYVWDRDPFAVGPQSTYRETDVF